jgi:hypothetical protein
MLFLCQATSKLEDDKEVGSISEIDERYDVSTERNIAKCFCLYSSYKQCCRLLSTVLLSVAYYLVQQSLRSGFRLLSIEST